MKRLDRIKDLKTNFKLDYNPYSREVKKKLFELNVSGSEGNLTFDKKILKEPDEKIIKKIAKIINHQNGNYKEYFLWFHEPTKCYRLVFGK